MPTCETDIPVMTGQSSEPVVESPGDLSRPIIFFDGVCGLCNTSIDQVIRWDRRGVFRFAPLQGETARQVLTPADTQQLGSVAVSIHGRIYRKSAAAVRILWQLGLLPSLAGTLMWLVPKPIRDWGYGVIAHNRYRWFGKKETCRMPTPAERARFLP